MVVEIIKDLFIDIIIGKDILKKHNGPGDELIIGAFTMITTSPSIDVPLLPLFLHLSVNTIPIITKSHHHTISDNKFMREETARLLKEGLIELSVSP